MEGKIRYWRRPNDRRVITSKFDFASGGYIEVTREDYKAWREWANNYLIVSQPTDLLGRQRLKLQRIAKKAGIPPRELASRWLAALIDKSEE